MARHRATGTGLAPVDPMGGSREDRRVAADGRHRGRGGRWGRDAPTDTVPAFLALNFAAAVLTTTIVAAIGFSLGQSAVNAMLLVDRYAGWVSLALIALLMIAPAVRHAWSRRRTNRVAGRRGAARAG